MPLFRDRHEAGRLLAQEIARRKPARPIVLALPRGGVPVASEIASLLQAPLSVFVSRKLGAPANREYGLGAVAEGGHSWVNPETVQELRVTGDQLRAILEDESAELARRVRTYRGGRPLPDLTRSTAILVDDGLATGVTARVALQALRDLGPRALWFAAPVGSESGEALLKNEADAIICLETPENFRSVGSWYEDFSEVSDGEVLALLRGDPSVRIDAGGVTLAGELIVPHGARGIVIFAHGSGSSRRSPRNRQVARDLRAHGMGTLLLDLLTPAESADPGCVFDVELLGARLVRAIGWLRGDEIGSDLPLGLFGASTGAAAALWAAARQGDGVAAVASRGGRPDLALSVLDRVQAPTLLIVGTHDPEVLRLNRMVLPRLRRSELRLIQGASHLFEEPGALAQVAAAAAQWFSRHFEARSRREAA